MSAVVSAMCIYGLILLCVNNKRFLIMLHIVMHCLWPIYFHPFLILSLRKINLSLTLSKLRLFLVCLSFKYWLLLNNNNLNDLHCYTKYCYYTSSHSVEGNEGLLNPNSSLTDFRDHYVIRIVTSRADTLLDTKPLLG